MLHECEHARYVSAHCLPRQPLVPTFCQSPVQFIGLLCTVLMH